MKVGNSIIFVNYNYFVLIIFYLIICIMFLCAFNFTREIMSKTIIHNVCVCVCGPGKPYIMGTKVAISEFLVLVVPTIYKQNSL